MSIKQINATIIFLLFFSCVENKDSNIKSIYLKGEVMEFESSPLSICRPVQILTFDKYLVIVNRPPCEYGFTIIDKIKGQVVNHAVKYGKGPEEYAGIWAIVKSNILANHLEFFDVYKLGCYRINIEDMVNQANPKIIQLAQFKQIGEWSNIGKDKKEHYSRPSAAYYIKNDLLITTDYFEQGMIGLVDSTGNLIETYFSYPNDDKANVPNELKKGIYQFIFRSHPAKDIYVNAYFNSDWLLIYNKSNRKNLNIVFNNYTYLPKYDNLAGGPVINLKKSGNHEVGNVGLDVNKHKIYVLRSKKKLKEAVNRYRKDNSTPFINVFNWNGDHLIYLKLDHKVDCISVDSNDDFLYAISFLDDYTFIKYELPNL